MHTKDLAKKLLNYTITNSGAEHRTYLGMSAIGRCQRQLYHDLLHGREWTTQAHFYCYLGYLFERDILARLAAIDPNLLGPGQEFSDFAGRFMGHSDGEWDGDLLEVKSTTEDRLPNGRIPDQHFWQIQTYMHYGDYARAKIIYIARDTGSFRVRNIDRVHKMGELARIKAATILEAVDLRQPLACECGRCELKPYSQNHQNQPISQRTTPNEPHR